MPVNCVSRGHCAIIERFQDITRPLTRWMLAARCKLSVKSSTMSSDDGGGMSGPAAAKASDNGLEESTQLMKTILYKNTLRNDDQGSELKKKNMN